MLNWIYIDLIAFLVVVVVTGLIIPQILLIAFRKNLFDAVDPRKIHQGAVPRLGGIAFFPAILFSIFLMFGLYSAFAPETISTIPEESYPVFCFIGCAIIILYLVGIADDLVGLKYRAKFVAQIISSALVVMGGVYIDNLHGFLGIYAMPLGITVTLTILLIVFITNAINLIDGIDGLASGMSAIACIFYGFVFFSVGLHFYALLAFATLGALLPFFYYNVFGNVNKHSKIFMGDTGALTIGLILSALSIRICRIDDMPGSVNNAVVAFAPLLIPGFDVVRVYLHRLKLHRNPFLPDKTHIHHKLLALGISQRLAMPTIIAASFILTGLNYILSSYINITLLFFLDLVLWITVNSILSYIIRRRQRITGIIMYK